MNKNYEMRCEDGKSWDSTYTHTHNVSLDLLKIIGTKTIKQQVNTHNIFTTLVTSWKTFPNKNITFPRRFCKNAPWIPVQKLWFRAAAAFLFFWIVDLSGNEFIRTRRRLQPLFPLKSFLATKVETTQFFQFETLKC